LKTQRSSRLAERTRTLLKVNHIVSFGTVPFAANKQAKIYNDGADDGKQGAPTMRGVANPSILCEK
jgi:hypothetical protein